MAAAGGGPDFVLRANGHRGGTRAASVSSPAVQAKRPRRRRPLRLALPSAHAAGAAILLFVVGFWLVENFVRSPADFVNLVLIGVTVGAIYGLIALGYTLIYALLDTINFAHGDVFILGAMIAASLARRLDLAPDDGAATLAGKLVAMLAAAMTLSAVASGAIEAFVFRPLRTAPRVSPLIASIGVVFVLENVLLVWQGNAFNAISPVLPHQRIFETHSVVFSWNKLIVIGLVVSLLLALRWLLQRTRHGLAMRAAAQDREAAALCGVNVNRTILGTFMLAGALAGGAGFVYLVYVTNVAWEQGFSLGLVALTAAVLGGIGNLVGAVVGAILIGVVESLNNGLQWYAPGSDWTSTVIFVILILLLVLRPQGVLGSSGPPD